MKVKLTKMKLVLSVAVILVIFQTILADEDARLAITNCYNSVDGSTLKGYVHSHFYRMRDVGITSKRFHTQELGKLKKHADNTAQSRASIDQCIACIAKVVVTLPKDFPIIEAEPAVPEGPSSG